MTTCISNSSVLLAMGCLVGHHLHAYQHVAPVAYSSMIGDSATGFPLLNNSGKTQFVYAASEFAGLQRPQAITGVAFKFRTATSTFFLATRTVEIRMSTTSRAPDGLSDTFATNVGPDETVVFSGSTTKIFSGSQIGTFGFGFTFQQPFLYDHSAGNLLVEIRGDSGWTASGYSLDGSTSTSDGMSRLSAGTTGATTGTLSSTCTIAQFTLRDQKFESVRLLDGNQVEMKWKSLPGAVYTLESAPSATGTFVPVVANIAATAPTNTLLRSSGALGVNRELFRLLRTQ